jgi:hypothetical protein
VEVGSAAHRYRTARAHLTGAARELYDALNFVGERERVGHTIAPPLAKEFP